MPAGNSSQLEVVVFNEERQFARCLLQPGKYSIGHERTNEISIDEASISARHARLTVVSAAEIYIEDAGSSNGTYVDDCVVERPTPIALDSRVQVGACTLELRKRHVFAESTG